MVKNMDKKEAFKSFAKSHPELVNSIKTGDASWQKLYEIYDIYGEDDRAWNTYFNKGTTSSTGLGNITDIVKKIDMDSVQKLSARINRKKHRCINSSKRSISTKTY